MHRNQMEMDEALAMSLMYDDPTINDEITARQLQQEVNPSTSLNRDSSPHHQSHVGDSSSQPLPSNDDIDPENMTYEELNELGESIGAVSKGLSQSRIDQIPTHKHGATAISWFKNKISGSGQNQ
ncbi:unnamed protein product [Microthlaspi erraticum]|uniref:Uncharacterized protein n=1 Tax=Microthlaspi erraticum TaxID=1685480 RepID=A0A6D2I7Q0_9BRAS|nr:unnamed protein product [Microthlaspi erraticum]